MDCESTHFCGYRHRYLISLLHSRFAHPTCRAFSQTTWKLSLILKQENVKLHNAIGNGIRTYTMQTGVKIFFLRKHTHSKIFTSKIAPKLIFERQNNPETTFYVKNYIKSQNFTLKILGSSINLSIIAILRIQIFIKVFVCITSKTLSKAEMEFWNAVCFYSHLLKFLLYKWFDCENLVENCHAQYKLSRSRSGRSGRSPSAEDKKWLKTIDLSRKRARGYKRNPHGTKCWS